MFTVPVTGVWRVAFSLQSGVGPEKENIVYIYHNKQQIEEARHATWSQHQVATSTGGRELFTRADQGDTFHLGTGTMDFYFLKIIACFEFVSL